MTASKGKALRTGSSAVALSKPSEDVSAMTSYEPILEKSSAPRKALLDALIPSQLRPSIDERKDGTSTACGEG